MNEGRRNPEDIFGTKENMAKNEAEIAESERKRVLNETFDAKRIEERARELNFINPKEATTEDIIFEQQRLKWAKRLGLDVRTADPNIIERRKAALLKTLGLEPTVDWDEIEAAIKEDKVTAEEEGRSAFKMSDLNAKVPDSLNQYRPDDRKNFELSAE